jgi:hypothetical protein
MNSEELFERMVTMLESINGGGRSQGGDIIVLREASKCIQRLLNADLAESA